MTLENKLTTPEELKQKDFVFCGFYRTCRDEYMIWSDGTNILYLEPLKEGNLAVVNRMKAL